MTHRTRTRTHAIKSLAREIVEKGGGPYIGPRGGKWADPQHTIHWDPDAEDGRGSATQDVTEKKQFQAAAEAIFGKGATSEDVLRAAGIPPTWGHVRLSGDVTDGSVVVNVTATDQGSGGELNGSSHRRFILNRKTGERHVEHISTHIAPGDQGEGVGLRMFLTEVTECSKHGFSTVQTFARGEKGSGFNGYYTWPRLGFDAPIPDIFKNEVIGAAESGEIDASMKKVFSGKNSPQNISDLMRDPSLRRLWKDYGSGAPVDFDLSQGSLSMKVLSEYARSRGVSGSTRKKG